MPPNPGSGQHDASGRLGNVGCGGDGDSHLSLAKRRRVVGPVAAHPDRVAALLERFDQVVLSLRKDASVDGEIFRANTAGMVPGGDRRLHPRPTARATIAAVAGASPVTITVRTPSVCNSLTSAAESARGGSLSAMIPASFTAPGGPMATASTRKPLASSWFAILEASGRCLRKGDDGSKSPLDRANGGPTGIYCRGLGHLGGGVKGHKLFQFGQVGGGCPGGGGANGHVYGVLPSIRTGESGDSQDVRFVKPARSDGRPSPSAHFRSACRSYPRTGPQCWPLRPRRRVAWEGRQFSPAPGRQWPRKE